jgi:hypothetical protein
MWIWLGRFAVLFAVIGALWRGYMVFIKPKRLKTKLQKFNEMITDWFDEIDCNIEAGLNMAVLNNKENKIREFIKDKLPSFWIRPSRKMIRKWNKEMGFKKEYWDSHEKFREYSRVPSKGMPLDFFFNMLVAKFLSFKAHYPPKQNGGCNFAEIEMLIKFFKFYIKQKGYRG